MSDQDFEDLLAAYLENEVSEEQIEQLYDLVDGSERLRNRFQEESRVHVLMRENLNERVELNDLYRSVTPLRSWKNKTVLERALAAAMAIAAMVMFVLSVAYLTQRPSGQLRNQMGNCMSVSEKGGFSIKRNSKLLPASDYSPVAIGDQLICDDQTHAMIRLKDKSILALEPGAILTLVSDAPEVSVQKGEVLFEIAPRKKNALPFQVTTSQSTVDVMGTVFSISEDKHTELKVYEGSVTLTRHRDNARVDVESQQMATTAEEDLEATSLSGADKSLTPEIIVLKPTDDITLEDGRPVDSLRLMVESDRRVCFMRFMVPDVGAFQAATLRLTQDIDPGKGRLSFFKGDHADWNESNINAVNAPDSMTLVGTRRGVVRRGQTVEVDVSHAVQDAGPLTIIMKLDKKNQNDIWFASRENVSPPQLILAYIPHSDLDVNGQ